MGTPKTPDPVLFFVGAILADPALDAQVRAALTDAFGPVTAESDLFPFGHTGYYAAEMGDTLHKKFYAFDIIPPDTLADAKLRTNAIEQAAFSRAPGRPSRSVNLDPGYISPSALILATTKNHAHRIYLRDGIYAEVTLRFHTGAFQPWEWTYPDFRTREYIEFFTGLRETLMRRLKPAAPAKSKN